MKQVAIQQKGDMSMAKRKKLFSCGHYGKGQYCHRCRQEEEKRQQRKQYKQEWMQRKSRCPVSLQGIDRKTADKAMNIIHDLQSGTPYYMLNGKRLSSRGVRHIIRVPVGRNYRLICRDMDGKLEFLELLSHETYSSRLQSGNLWF